jgi:hypothetical protein
MEYIHNYMEEIKKLKLTINYLEAEIDKLEYDIINNCNHVFEKEIPHGPRDNGEFYYTCIHCGLQK